MDTLLKDIFSSAENEEELEIGLESAGATLTELLEVGVNAGAVPSAYILGILADKDPLFDGSPEYLTKMATKMPYQSMVYWNYLMSELQISHYDLPTKIKMYMDLVKSGLLLIGSNADLAAGSIPVVENKIYLHKDLVDVGATEFAAV